MCVERYAPAPQSRWEGRQVTETLRAGLGHPQPSSAADPNRSSKVTLMGPPATEAFPRSPGEAGGQPDSRQLVWTAWTPGELPAGSCWPRRRSPEPATGPASGVTYKHRMTATLGGRASLPNPHATPGSRGAWPLLGGGWSKTSTHWDSSRAPSPGPNANRAWGLRKDPLRLP